MNGMIGMMSPDREMVFQHLYIIRGLDHSVSLRELVHTSSSRELAECIRLFLGRQGMPYYVKPLVNYDCIRTCLDFNIDMVFECVCCPPNKPEWNRYKLTNSLSYHRLMESVERRERYVYGSI